MNTGEIIGIIMGPIGIAGILYTIYYGRKNIKKKLLVYENSYSIPLAQAFSPEDDYTLSVVFERKGIKEERIESVYTTFLKFANLGREPIRGSDIAPSNPLKIEVEDTRTLDIQMAGRTREVNKIYMEKPVVQDTKASAELHFDFLDCNDGALQKILTDGSKGKISLTGDIIGMPEGIKNIKDTKAGEAEGNISGWFVGIITLAILASSALIHYWVTGSWNNVWLMLVPLGVLLIFSAAIALAAWVWPSRRPSFPKSLDLPEWCRSFPFYPTFLQRAELLGTQLEEKNVKSKLELERLQKEIDELKNKN